MGDVKTSRAVIPPFEVPEEDCFAGQMAIVRGGSVKKKQAESNDVDGNSDSSPRPRET